MPSRSSLLRRLWRRPSTAAVCAVLGLVTVLAAVGTVVGVTAASSTASPLAWSLPARADSAVSDPSPSVTVNGVACVASGCVAVDADGVMASSNPYASSGTWTLTAIDPYALDDVSCATTSTTTGCVAVDTEGNVLASTDPFDASPTWSTTTVRSGVDLLSVSCAANGSTADCAALSAEGDVAVSTNAFAASPSWKVQQDVDTNLPDEPSCLATNCAFGCTNDGCVIADGNGSLVGGNAFAASPTWSTTSWSGVSGPGLFYSVSCFSASGGGDDCVAVSDTGDAVTSTAPYSSNPSWSVHAAVSSPAYLIGVACTTNGCVGAGDDGGSVVVAATPAGSPLTSSAWSQSTASQIQSDAFDGAMSCFGSSCLAGDWYGNVIALTGFPSDSGWTEHSPVVAGAGYLGRLSCVLTSASEVGCVAVDGAGDVVTTPNAFAASPSWTTTNLDSYRLDDVSCVESGSTTQCAAVSSDGYLYTSTSPFTGGASSWTQRKTFVVNTPYFEGSDLTAITCLVVSGGTDCELGDAVGDLASSTDVFTAPTTPTFSVETFSDGQNVTGTDVTGIACLPIGTTPTCWAADNGGGSGYVIMATPFGASSSWSLLYTDSGSSFPSLADIDCVALTSSNAGCVASDDLGDVVSSATAAIASSWSASLQDETSASGYPDLGSVSCALPASASGATCAFGDAGGYDIASATTFNTPAWVTTKVSGSALAGVSCVATSTTVTSCVGTDQDGWIATASTPTGSAPSPPTGVTASAAGSGSADVSWTAPSGSVTSYTVYAYPAAQCGASSCSGIATTSATATGTSTSVNGLTNGTSYEFTVTATNASGTSAPSSPSNAVTPLTTPSAPTITGATAGSQSVELSWSVPSSNGGSPIESYTIDVWDASQCTGNPCTGSPVRDLTGLTGTSDDVGGLTNGIAYAFTVFAVNAQGAGPQSAPSASVTPATVPGMPTITGATAGNAKASLTWSAPSSNGGSAITSYTIDVFTCTSSSAASCSSTASSTDPVAASPTSANVNGLTNGDWYEFTVTAVNAVGSSQPSSPSSVVQPMAPASAPNAPTNVVASLPSNPPGDELDVTWTASTLNNPSDPVTGYVVDAYLSSQCSTACSGSPATTDTVGGSTTSAPVSSLSEGISYAFTVTAESSAGDSPASSPSNALTAATVPGAPTNVSATPGNASASVFWDDPADEGGDTITSYTADAYTTSQCTTTCSGTPVSTDTEPATNTFIPLSGLVNGTTYDVVVFATSAAGNSPVSSPLAAVTPATAPGAPTDVVAVPLDASATVTWSPPSSNGGSAITGYTIEVYRSIVCNPTCSGPPFQTDTTAATPTSYTASSLTNGKTFVLTVAATNTAGSGPVAQSNPVTPSAVLPTTTTVAPSGGGGGGSTGAGATTTTSTTTTTIVTTTTSPRPGPPVVALTGIGTVRKGVVAVAISCSVRACSGLVQLAKTVRKHIRRGGKKVVTVRLVAVATARYRLQPGAHTVVQLRLTVAENAALLRAPGRHLKLTLRASVAGGRTVQRAVVVKAAPKATAKAKRTAKARHGANSEAGALTRTVEELVLRASVEVASSGRR